MIDIVQLESAHTSGLYAKRPLAFVRGAGALLWDANGRAYIDCAAGQGVANLGHSHPVVCEAIAAQAQRLITCPESFYNDQRALLISRMGSLIHEGGPKPDIFSLVSAGDGESVEPHGKPDPPFEARLSV